MNKEYCVKVTIKLIMKLRVLPGSVTEFLLLVISLWEVGT